MSASDLTVSAGRAGASFPLMARIVGVNGNNLTQAVTLSVAYRIFTKDRSTPEVTGTLTVSAVIFDTLQTDDWDTNKDSSGYNFRWDVPGSLVPVENKDYFALLTFTGTEAAGSHVCHLLHKRHTRSWTED